MPRNGAGTFSLAEAPFVFDTVISETAVNSDLSDIANALTASLAKDGQTTPTANLPMGGYKHTGVTTSSGSSSRSEYASGATLQDGAPLDAGDTAGTSTAYTATLSPAITAYADKQCFRVKINAACGADPTINFNSVGAKKLYKVVAGAAVQLRANDLQAGDYPILRYDSSLDSSSGGFVVLNDHAATPAISRSSDTVLAGADFAHLFLATSTFTQTLTAAATLGNGWWVDYRNDGTGDITLDPNSSETIDGRTSLVLHPGDSARLIGDGSNFKTIGLTSFKIVTTTRDLSAADGNLAVTGAGFTPRLVLVAATGGAVGSSTGQLGLGIGRASSEVFGISNATNVAGGDGSWALTNSALIELIANGTTISTIDLVSLDSDGCTLSFTKTGSPSGTATLSILFVR